MRGEERRERTHIIMVWAERLRALCCALSDCRTHILGPGHTHAGPCTFVDLRRTLMHKQYNKTHFNARFLFTLRLSAPAVHGPQARAPSGIPSSSGGAWPTPPLETGRRSAAS